ncbi:MAG: FAD-dependent oxidoreductase [Planctomycetota bacterium]
MSHDVLILGGGVAGLSAAHELIERGFRVTVLEMGCRPGGKARSLPVPGSGIGNRKDLPAEHGFRFIPGFYKHIPDIMARIPVPGGTVADQLVAAQHIQIARSGGNAALFAPAKFPTNLADIVQAFRFFHEFYCNFGIPKQEVKFFIERLLTLMMSCPDRRFAEYEKTSWLTFIDARNKSLAYQKYLAYGLSRSLVALDPDRLSTRTGGYILLQFLFDFSLRPDVAMDRVLNGPTSDVWIDPWITYLRRRGVNYLENVRIDAIDFQRNRIQAISTSGRSGSATHRADHYIAAIPVEVFQSLLTLDMLVADPQLRGLRHLTTSWMTGVLFYLKRNLPIVDGHTNYLDSEWALTSISQPQFWSPQFDLAGYGDGTTPGILSVIISNWERRSNFSGKKASESTPQELVDEVWRQVKEHQNAGGMVLHDNDLARSFISPSVHYDPVVGWTNHEPLLINTVDSWKNRPEAKSSIPNLFLASDYVRTKTDLATMEGANEAARLAVNALLDAVGSTADKCLTWKMDEPVALAGMQATDRLLFEAGLPPPQFELPPLPWPCV